MKLFVWDFHGVLEKDNDRAVIEISNIILAKSGYRQRFTRKDSLGLYGKKWWQYFDHLLPQESQEKHFELQRLCIDYEQNHPQLVKKYIKANDCAHEVLKSISKKHEQIVISNMSEIALLWFLKIIDMDGYFWPDKAFATNRHDKFSTMTKVDVLRSYLFDKKFDDIITIGDTPEDIEMIKVTGGKTYLYTHKGLVFKKCKADYKINDLREVLREV